MVRVCDDGADDWTSGGGDVTSVAECEQKCSGYKYMALVKCRCFLDLIALAGSFSGKHDEHCRHARATTHLSAGAATSSTRTTWARSACLTRNAAATPATRPAWRRTATAPASQHRVSFSREGSCLVGLAVPRCSAPRSQLSGKQQLPLRLLAEVSKDAACCTGRATTGRRMATRSTPTVADRACPATRQPSAAATRAASKTPERSTTANPRTESAMTARAGTGLSRCRTWRSASLTATRATTSTWASRARRPAPAS